MTLKHLQTLQYLDLQNSVAAILQKRCFRPPPKKRHIRPRTFYLVERKGELSCVWNGNFRRKSDLLLAKVSQPDKGLLASEWHSLTRHIKTAIAKTNVLVIKKTEKL